MTVFATYFKETILILIFTLVVIANGADLFADLSHGADTEHIVKEVVVICFSIFAITLLLVGLYRQKLEIKSLQHELEIASKPQTPPKKYVLEARKKLGNVVTQQFSEWLLTSSEIEVGWLLLKGLSLKEISIVRRTQEKTVRQQASSIYKKSGVSGRHAFSAWFIEDIL
jgi:DNA-binding CsgD family transcriptional regulator